MRNCPQCGKARKGEEFKCPTCDVFYSKLDELLYEEQQKNEQNTLKGRLKIIFAADNRKQAAVAELTHIWKTTPLKTKITLWTIFAFVFALVVSVL
ncbi:hypothetical protein [Methylomonas sp. AM2-LC]|uniref:hypothetical protein n=1 Tax=Methylomonas sp. AM2-LC TaxID=3153301 RepID=UPI003265319B